MEQNPDRAPATDTGSATPPVVVFHDGSCPVCRREIAHYRRLDRDNRIRWVDVAAGQEALDDAGVTREQALRRFHVIDADGTLRSGAEAFTVLWAELPGWRHVARGVRALRLTGLLDFAYGIWAKRRWRRVQFRSGVCAAPASHNRGSG